MFREHWLRWFELRMQWGRMSRRGRRSHKRRAVRTALVAEPLEQRTLLTTFTVDNLIDESDGNFGPGDLSLREAIEQANAMAGADVIGFASNFGGRIIDLTLGSLTVTDSLSMVGFNNPLVLANGGLIVRADGPTDSVVFSMTAMGVNGNVNGPGLLIDSINDGFVTANISDVFFNNSATEGIKIQSHSGGEARLTISESSVNSNGDLTPSAGISVEVGVAAPAASPNNPGKFASARLLVTDVEVRNNALEGLKVATASGGTFQTPVPITNTTFAGNGQASLRNEVHLSATGLNSSIQARFEGVTANNAKASGFHFEGTGGGKLGVVVNNSSATGAGADAFSLLADGAGSAAAVSVNNLLGDNAGLYGADFDVTNGAVVRVNNFNNVSLQNAGHTGLDVDLNRATMTDFIAANVNVSGSAISGMDLFLRQGLSTWTFNGITANNNGERGVQINSVVNADATVTLNNVSAVGNQTKQPLNIVVDNNATLNLDVNGGTITSAGTAANNSVFSAVKNGSTGNLSFNGLTVNNSSSSAFVTRYDHDADGHFEITNTTATGSQVVGMALFVYDGSQVTGNFSGLNVSGSGVGIAADAIRIDVNGLGTTADFTFNNVTANNATGSGIALQYANKATGGITRFDNVSAQNAQRDALLIDIRGTSQLTSFVGNGVNLSGAGRSGNPSHDALDLRIQGNNTAGSVNLRNLTANAAAGRGVNLSVQNAAVAEVVIDGFSANGSGLQGLNLIVGTIAPGAVLQNSLFRNGSFNNSGTGLGSDGVRARVTGVGTVADVTFSGVTANNNLRGYDALVNNGADFTMAVEGTSNADSNFFDGVFFRADGPNTTAALTSSAAGSSFDGNGDAGLVALITNGATVTDLTVIAVVSNNGEDGMIIDADDRSGVTINNLSLAGSSFASNMFTGLILTLDSVLGLNEINLDGLNASGNLGLMTGLNIDVANMTLDSFSANNLNLQSNGGAGLDLLLQNVDVTGNVDVTNFNAGGNGADGVRIALEDTTSIAGALRVDGNSSSNMAGGLSIIATDGSGVSIGDFQVSGTALAVNNNSGNGVTVDLNGVIGIDSIDFSNMTVNNNAGNQVFVRMVDMAPLTTVSFDDISAIGPGSGTGDGINLTLDNTDVTDSLALNRIDASNNGQDGLEINLLNGADIPSSSIDVGTFDANGRHGINLNITNSTAQIDVTNSTFDLLDTIASASGNGGNGLNVRMANANLTMNSIDHIVFDGNLGAGVDIQAATPSDFQSGSSFTNNTVTNNGSFGFRAIFNGGNFDISIGSRTTPGMGSVFDNNVAAAINLDMLQNSLGRFAVVDNTITNTNDDGNPLTDFQGAGVFVRMLGTANPNQATNTLIDPSGNGPGLLIRDNVMGGTDAMGMPIGNDGSGINFRVEERSIIDGLHVLDNEVSNSGIDGLNFRRLDEVTINDFQIVGNAFNDSGDDGVEIIAQNDDASAMDITISSNEMNGNTDHGAALQVNADAKLNLDMQSNSLISNGNNGVNLSEVALDVDDDRAIFGTIAGNTISDNMNLGVNAAAFMGVTFGTIVTPLDVFDNSIGAVLDQFGQIILDGNGSTGVYLTGGGDSVWTNNDIIRNGRLVTADRTVGHGIDIEDDFFGFYTKNIVLDSNRIRENFQDGIEINNHGQSQDPNFAFFFNTSFFVDMIDNRVQANVGRGLDILNQLLTDTFVTIRSSDPSDPSKGNFFNSNGEEGIYAVNTASSTQTQDAFASTLLAMDGSVLVADPQLSLVIDHATISNNGDDVNVPGMVQSAGLVVRVGSAGQGTIFGDSSTDFATSLGSNTGFIPPAVVGGPVVPTFANAGVYLQVTNSTMLGNFGDDAFLHGFTSTPNPSVIGGTWNMMMFAPMIMADGIDPLARLDVYWGTDVAGNGNTFDSVEVNNQFGIGIPSTPKGEPGAYYDTGEGTFKSRSVMMMPPGPFGNNQANRRRNAQRVAERTYPGGFTLSPDPATSPDGGIFLYPGMGDSTFRAFAGGDTAIAAELAAIGFLFDDNPVGGDFSPIEGPFFGEVNGTPFGPGVGGLPFGWGTY